MSLFWGPGSFPALRLRLAIYRSESTGSLVCGLERWDQLLPPSLDIILYAAGLFWSDFRLISLPVVWGVQLSPRGASGAGFQVVEFVSAGLHRVLRHHDL